MLVNDMRADVLLVGLSTLINSGKPGFDGHYRVVTIGAQVVIEFFEGAAAGGGMLPVKIVPYRTDTINTMTVGTVEAISGEFTGCVMTLFTEGGARKVGHVDTNTDTSQRAAYEQRKKNGEITVIDEFDSAGKLSPYPMLTGATRILCLASGDRVVHYFVDKETHQYSGNVPVPGGGGTTFGVKNETRYRILHSHGH